MKIYLKDQKNRLQQQLDLLKNKEVVYYNKSCLKEKSTIVDIKTNKTLEQLNLDFLFDYQIFPKHILMFKSQWSEENREIKTGDTITQQICIPPTKFPSIKVVFGVRIKEIISYPNKKGFSYETLEGHVEQGISTFTVEQDDRRIIFKIHTFSKPGTILTRLFGIVFSTPYQTFCTKAALNNVKRCLENQ